MNHPFYIDKEVYKSYSGSPVIIDLDAIKLAACKKNTDEDDEWYIELYWIHGFQDNESLSFGFGEEDDKNQCFADMRKAIFIARDIDEKIP